MPDSRESQKPLEILLVEDAPGDVRLASEALKQFPVENHVHVAKDGEEALGFLRRKPGFENAPKPDLVLLDLNLPRVNGHEVLQEVKKDSHLRHIPVVVLTGSRNEEDIFKAYDAHANCYVTKPPDLQEYFSVMESIGEFWFNFAQLPSFS